MSNYLLTAFTSDLPFVALMDGISLSMLLMERNQDLTNNLRMLPLKEVPQLAKFMIWDKLIEAFKKLSIMLEAHVDFKEQITIYLLKIVENFADLLLNLWVFQKCITKSLKIFAIWPLE
jgi:hypothetical protein